MHHVNQYQNYGVFIYECDVKSMWEKWCLGIWCGDWAELPLLIYSLCSSKWRLRDLRRPARPTCGCLLYWCIHFVAVTKGSSCLSSLAGFFFHPYLHIDWAKDPHFSMSIRSAVHPPTSSPPCLLSACTQQFHESPQVHTISPLLLPLCWLHTRNLPKQNNPPIYRFALSLQRQQLKQKVPCRQLMLCHVFLPSHSFHCCWWLSPH